MSGFDTEVLLAHAESVDFVGEEMFLVGTPVSGILSEITTNETPALAGFDKTAEAIFTVSKTALSAASVGISRLNGTVAKRKATNKFYRITETVDNGGGLVDLILTSTTQ